MRSEPSPEHDGLRPRPLPSVDIALLPNEVRAARAQRVVIVSLCAVAALGGVFAAFGPQLLSRLGRRDDAEAAAATAASGEALASESEPSVLAAAPAPQAPTVPQAAVLADEPRPEDLKTSHTPDTPVAAEATPPPTSADEQPSELGGARVERKFGSANSFKDALVKAGASPTEANDLIDALQKLVDFRRGRPEQTLVFERDADSALRLFEYRAGLTEVYRVTRARDGKLRGERVNVPIEKRRIAKGTHIVGSLGQSLAALGLGPALAGAVIEAFDAKISFKKDTREGDSVKLIVDEEYVDGTFLRYGNVLAVEYSGEKAGRQQAFWFEGERGGEFYDPNGRAMHGGWLRTPLRYDHISSGYNLRRRHPILKRIIPHNGVDYSAGTGTPVWAAADGTVTFSGARGANGNLVSLKHGNGYETFYAHLWRIATGMRPGTRVKQKQVIGYVGTTGRSTGPHLHFALKRNGRFLDPASQLNGPGLPLPGAAMGRFRTAAQRLRAELERIPLATPTAITPIGSPSSEDEAAHIEEDLDL